MMRAAGAGGAVASAAVSERERLLAIEHAAVRAWPAGETREVDGWLWRYSGGGSQRANSVSALHYLGTDVERTIDAIEHLYGERGAPVRFQVGFPLSEPEDLDARLAARGYVIHDPVTTLVKAVEAVAMPDDVALGAAPSEGWLRVYLSNVTPDRRPFASAILARVPAPCVFAEVLRSGETIATALGVLHEGAVIAECVGTASSARRQGAASAVMSALEAWGSAQGARTIGLQAVTTNTPAQGLYAALGYTAAGTYHYRYLQK
ncbi:MAG TPA: GNAT family N-acetyltransferase [Hyphomicrobiaceae bacterium]|nr:GNAT family N-acetyltransferase [Hyphomicrobiaceae bacterium]